MSNSANEGPQVGDLVIVRGPLARVVELVTREEVEGAVVTANDAETVWVPLSWLLLVPLGGEDGRR